MTWFRVQVISVLAVGLSCGGSRAIPGDQPDAGTGGSGVGTDGSGGGTGGGGAPAHRADRAACPPSVAAPSSLPPTGCTQNATGGCDQCLSDEDCGATGVCSCQGQTFGYSHVSAGNVCVPANCRVDADCGTGGFCSPTTSLSCGSFYGVQGYYCHTPADQCVTDADCAAGTTCRYSEAVGAWVCASGFCAG